jgi:hypothetical protein
LYRYRNQALYLNSALCLTRDGPARLRNLLVHVRSSQAVLTCVSTDNSTKLIGQIHHPSGERVARLAYVLPASELEPPQLTELLEGLAHLAGERGAFQLLGEIEENHPVFTTLRRVGFSVYAWQRIWYLPDENLTGPGDLHWQVPKPEDENAIRSLYQFLAPPIVQAAEPLPSPLPEGLVYRQEGEILAYVEGFYGPHGIYLRPLVHPDIENVISLLKELRTFLQPLAGRPLYIALPSYLPWLESALEREGSQLSQRQALLVKHLTHTQRVPHFAELLSAQHTAESRLPLAQHYTTKNKGLTQEDH